MKKFIIMISVGLIFMTGSQTFGNIKLERGSQVLGRPGSEKVLDVTPDCYEFTTRCEKLNSKRQPRPTKLTKDNLYDVKCIFNYDASQYRPSSVIAYNESNSDETHYDYENDFINLNLPDGIYDFFVSFYRISETSFFGDMGLAYLILEDIEIKGDCEIELDASLITEEIKFETYNPDGEKSRQRYLRYLNENWDWEIIEEYTVYNIYCDNLIICDKYEFFYNNHNNCGGIDVELGPFGENKSEWYTTIYINPLSEKYQLAQLRMMYTEDECYILPLFPEGNRSQTVTNKNDSYSDKLNILFDKSPNGKDCQISSLDPFLFGWSINNSLASNSLTWNISTNSDAFFNIYYCDTSSSKKHPEYICYTRFQYEDIAENEYYSKKLISPDIVLGMNSYTLFPLPNNRYIRNLEGGQSADLSYPIQIGCHFNNQNIPIFNSSPLFTRFFYLLYNSPLTSYPYPMLQYTNVGFKGDYHEYDEGDFTISLNDNLVCTSSADLINWQRECQENPIELGKTIFTYKNDNYMVDEIRGTNTAKVYFDTSLNDGLAPLLQLIYFKDKNDILTERFQYAADGFLTIVGGDFKENRGPFNKGIEEEPLWYDVMPCDISVEYSPYQSNIYYPLDITVVEEPLIGYGNIHCGSLETVTEPSSTGWYDLRVKLTDEAGNYNEQVISPAFKIDQNTGLQKATFNKSNLRVENRKVISDTNEFIRVYTLQGKSIENKNLPNGIYIAKSNDSIIKLIIK